MSIGKCDSCLNFSLLLREQENFGTVRNMCPKCCDAANQVEIMMSPPDTRAEQARQRWLKSVMEQSD